MMKSEASLIYYHLIDYLIKKQGYLLVAVDKKENDTWLVKRQTDHYPIIRLSVSDEPSDNVHYLAKVKTSIGQLLGIDHEILDLYITDKELIEHDDLRQISSFNRQSINLPDFKEIFSGVDVVFDLAAKKKRPGGFSLVTTIKQNKVTFGISLLVILLYLIQQWLIPRYGEGPTLVFLGAVYKHLIYGGGQWWRLISSGFLHGSIEHLLLNLVAFSSLGRLNEQVYGSKKTLIIMLASIVVGSLTSLVTVGSNTVSLGLSGGLYGLLAANLVYLFESRLILVRNVKIQVIQILLLNLFISLMPGISFWGHLGGFVMGLFITLLFSPASKNRWFKTNVILASCALIGGLVGFARYVDPNTELIINNIVINKRVVEMMSDFKLGYWAERLETRLEAYYQMKGWYDN